MAGGATGMTRGEVWWVEAPRDKRRPYLVLTRDTAIPVLSELIAVPTTSTVRGIPTEIALGVGDGMPDDCVLSVDSTTLVPKVYFRERICRLTPSRMETVCDTLAIATGCR